MSANVPKHNVIEKSAASVVLQASTVDVLLPTKPIKIAYIFNNFFLFKIAHVDQLLLHKTELRGKEFQLPGFNFRAQIQCDVIYDLFQLSIRFVDVANEGKAMHWGITPIVTILVINRNKCYGSTDEKLCYVFPLNTQLVYGTFYPFCALSYGKKLKKFVDSFSDSITLHLYERSVVSSALLVADGMFLWKVDVSHARVQHGACLENEKQLTISPILCTAQNRVRLFLHDLNCYVEVKHFGALNTSDNLYEVHLTVIHPSDSTERIKLSLKRVSRVEALVEMQPIGPNVVRAKAPHIFVLADIEKLLPYMYNNKLILAVEI